MSRTMVRVFWARALSLEPHKGSRWGLVRRVVFIRRLKTNIIDHVICS